MERRLVHPEPERNNDDFLRHALNPGQEIDTRVVTKNGGIKEIAIRATLHPPALTASFSAR
jgi:hypothetical protein